MRKLEHLIRFESANSALAFRKTTYDSTDRETLLIDVLALANARVDGPRYLVFGIDDEIGGERGLKGVDRRSLPGLVSRYRHTLERFVEPELAVSLRSVVVHTRVVAVLVLQDCSKQPYVLRSDVSGRMRKGDSWIRRGTRQTRLAREDVRNMSATQTLTGTGGCEMQVTFDTSALSSSLTLPVLPLTAKPSEQARARIEGMLDAKKAAHERLGRTDTWMDRLAFARAHGADQPYETVSPMSLLVKLGKSEEENAAADRYYENELRAHRVNLAVLNAGDGPLNNATIMLEVPVTDGVAVADRIHPPVGVAGDDIADGYPAVERTERATRVFASLGSIFPGARVRAFRQALRVLLREGAAGRAVPIRYEIAGDELREPVSGSLSIRVCESDSLVAD
ncbi:MAG: hypothetical protein R3288_02040 [Woeseiaceae bacterium]|nr:hypothetical protein [Woeseiaceae bacterium]